MINFGYYTNLGLAISTAALLQACSPLEGTLRTIEAIDAVSTVVDELSRTSEKRQDSDLWESVTAEDLAKISDDALCSFERHEKIEREILKRDISCQ